MTNRRLILPLSVAPTIVALVLLAALAIAPRASSQTLLSASPDSPIVRLSTPTSHATGVKAFAASAYVHQANCMTALAGGNGDNDVQAWINTHTPYGIVVWAWDPGYSRVSNTRFVQYVDLYAGSPPRFWGALPGYCMGDDSAIVDKFADAPAGW